MSNKEQQLRNNLYKALTEYLIPDSKNASDLLKYGRETFLDQLAMQILLERYAYSEIGGTFILI